MEITHRLEGDILVVDLKGNLRNKVMYKMKPLILDIVNKNFKKVILDMQDVESVDESWCAYLCKMYKVMNGYGRNLVITRCPEDISACDYTKPVKTLFPLFATLEEAQKHFNPDKGKKDEIASLQSRVSRKAPSNGAGTESVLKDKCNDAGEEK